MNAVANKPRAKKLSAATAAKPAQEVVHPTVVVVKTLAELVDRALMAHEASDLQSHEVCMHGQTLVEMGLERLRSVRNEPLARDEPFFNIAALLAGALAHDREKSPTAVSRHALLQEAYNLAESATISYGCSEAPCVALANGIVAGRATLAGGEPSVRSSAQIAAPLSMSSSTPEAAQQPFDTDAASLILQRAVSISSLLMNVFGGGTAVSPEEIRELTGLMGSIQHLRRLLEGLEKHATESAGSAVSGNVYGLIVEAAHLAILIDETEWLGGFEFHHGDAHYCCYFDTIRAACQAADEALEASVAS